MQFGLQIALMRREPWRNALQAFRVIQQEFSLQACELHLEASLYEAAFWPWEEGAKDEILVALRPAVRKLGIHLPFFEMNPVSANPRIAEASKKVLGESICFASEVGADYVVFHARGQPASVAERAPDEAIWLEVVLALARRASDRGVSFCLENADNLRRPESILKILNAQPENVKCCLDIGHLYERDYAPSILLRNLLSLNDRLSPIPFVLKSGLPVAGWGSWTNVLAAFGKHLGCVHVHNHDGRTAHQPLRRGKINLSPLSEFREDLREVPVILEADYRNKGLGAIREDLRYLEKQLCS